MCSLAGNLCFKNVYRSYIDLSTMEQCFVTLFYKTVKHSMLMYILCTVLNNMYDSKVLQILCVSLLIRSCLVPFTCLPHFYLQFLVFSAPSRLCCMYVICIIFQNSVVWLFKLGSSFTFFFFITCILFVPTFWRNVRTKLAV
jgi:hypothetical protein